MQSLAGLHCRNKAGPPGIKETAVTSCIQKPVNEFGPKMAILDTLALSNGKAVDPLSRLEL